MQTTTAPTPPPDVVELCVGGCGQPRPTLNGFTLPYCATCAAAADKRDRADDQARAQGIADEERCALIRRLAQDAGSRMARFTLDSYPADIAGQRALDAAHEWLSARAVSPQQNLILFGGVGTGKTGLALGIARRLCDEGTEARFVNWRDLLERIRADFDTDHPQRPARGLDRTPVVVVDDLGAERPTAWALEQLALIVETRYRNGLPTIATTNYEPHQLIKRFGGDDPVIGQRIVSRLVDEAIQHRLIGSDRRITLARARTPPRAHTPAHASATGTA